MQLGSGQQYHGGMKDSPAHVKFCLVWAGFVGLKLIFAIFLQPLGDEAFYWWEGQHLAWAYSDLPGMTAWLTWFGTTLAGNTPFGLRWPFVLISAAIPWLVIRIARAAGDRDGWQAGLLSVPIPLLLPMGLMALPDAPLTLAFLLCVDAALSLRRAVSMAACLQLAIGLAIGALAHYRFAPLLLGGALGFLLIGGLTRLRDLRLWLALIIGVLAWLPLIIYNAAANQHDAGLSFQLIDRHPWSFDLLGFAQPLAQALVISPVLYGLCIWALWQCAKRWRKDRSSPFGLLLGACGLPLLLYFLLSPFADQARTSFHWSIQAILPLIAVLPMLVTQQLASYKAKRWLSIAFWLAMGLSIIISAWLIAAASPALTARLAGSKLAVDNLVGWNEISKAVKQQQRRGEIFIADNFMLAAQLALALDRPHDLYSLNHPLNSKHGRAKQLADWHYDEAALQKLTFGRSVLIIVERQTSKPSKWPAWRDRLCTLFHDIRLETEVAAPGQPYRFLLYRGKYGASTGECRVEDAPVPR